MTTLYDVVYELNRAAEAHEAAKEVAADAYKRRNAAEKAFQEFVGAFVSVDLPAIVEIGYKKFLLSFEISSQNYRLNPIESVYAQLINDTPKVPPEPEHTEGAGTQLPGLCTASSALRQMAPL